MSKYLVKSYLQELYMKSPIEILKIRLILQWRNFWEKGGTRSPVLKEIR